MDSVEWTGMVIAAVVALLAFGIARYVTRYVARRRAEKDAALAKATESRQVRRANDRKRK